MNSQQWTPNFRRPASPAVAAMMPLETLSGADVYGPPPAMPAPSGHGGYRMLYVEALDGYGPPPMAWLPPVAAAPAYEVPAPAAGSGVFGGMSLRTAAFIFGVLLGIVFFAIL